MSKPIEDYGVIGNMNSAALVGRDGSIDWLCLPRFDSAACFAALLGNAEHGRWLLAPEDSACHISRRYVPSTAVLETRFETAAGACTLIDFMRPTDDEEKVDVVSIVRGERERCRWAWSSWCASTTAKPSLRVRRRDYGLSASPTRTRPNCTRPSPWRAAT